MDAHTDDGPVVIAACGNAWAGDDCVGLVVAEQLRAKAKPNWQFREVGDFTEVLNFTDGAQVILIDAVSSGSPPGTLHLVPVTPETPHLDQIHSWSTHNCELWEAVALGKALGRRLPPMTLIGIECENVERGAKMSAAASHACDFVVENFEVLLRLASAGGTAGASLRSA